MLAVFDGHAGDKAAIYSAQNFMKNFKIQLAETEHDIPKSLAATFKIIDQEFCSYYNESGCTATCCVIDIVNKQIFTANAGDARVIFRADQTIKTTIDHKPSMPSEEERIK